MANGKKEAILGGSAGISPRKAMASGKMGGSFGVESFAQANRAGGPSNADHMAGTGSKMMDDGSRGIGDRVMHTKGMHGAQAAPDHGPTHLNGAGLSHYPK